MRFFHQCAHLGGEQCSPSKLRATYTLLTIIQVIWCVSCSLLSKQYVPRRNVSRVRLRRRSVYLYGSFRFASRNIYHSSAWYAHNFTARSLLRDFGLDRSLVRDPNMAAILKPRSMLWMGHGLPFCRIGRGRTAMVHEAKKSGQRHCYRGQRHWGYDIQLGYQCHDTEHRTGMGFSDTRDSNIRCQLHLCNSYQGSKQGYWDDTTSIRLPPIQEKGILAVARLGLLQYAGIHCSSVFTTKLRFDHWAIFVPRFHYRRTSQSRAGPWPPRGWYLQRSCWSHQYCGVPDVHLRSLLFCHLDLLEWLRCLNLLCTHRWYRGWHLLDDRCACGG